MSKQGSLVTIKMANYLKGFAKKETIHARNFVTSFVNYANLEVKWESAKPFKEIPGVMSLPFIGTAWQSMPIIGRYDPDRRHSANKDKRNRLGNIIRERFGSHNAVLCFTIEDLERVLNSEGIYPHTMELTAVKVYRESRKEFRTQGLIALQGKEWHDLRSKTQKHLLKPMAVQEYLEPMQDVARDFVKRIYDIRNINNEVPDLHKEICKWSIESVSFVGLDTRLGCLKSNLSPDSDGTRIVEAAMDIFECKSKLEAFTGYLQFWKLFSTPTWRKFTRANDVYSMIALKYVNEALNDLIHNTGTKNKKLTLLQAMLAQKDLSVPDAVVFVADLMMEGTETTSRAAGFLLYHLARNPEKQELLYEEVMRLLPTEDAKLNPSRFESFKYLKACWRESMRLTPIIAGNGRILAHDAVLSGYRVPAGTIAVVFYEDIYMDEALFKNPTEFLPERWMNRNERPRKFAFIPFGFGPRSCIGRRLAEIKTVALLSEILRNFKIEYHFEDIGIHSKMLNVPDKPLIFNFIERRPRNLDF